MNELTTLILGGWGVGGEGGGRGGSGEGKIVQGPKSVMVHVHVTAHVLHACTIYILLIMHAVTWNVCGRERPLQTD